MFLKISRISVVFSSFVECPGAFFSFLSFLKFSRVSVFRRVLLSPLGFPRVSAGASFQVFQSFLKISGGLVQRWELVC